MILIDGNSCLLMLIKNDPVCAVAKNEDCPKAIPELVATLLFRQPLADLS